MFNVADYCRQKLGYSLAPRNPCPTQRESRQLAVRTAQRETYPAEMSLLAAGEELSNSHHLTKLSPIIDQCGLMRVGGRLRHACLPMEVKHPILLPKGHPLTTLIVKSYHEEVRHQGRFITHSAVRNAGFFIEKGKALVKKIVGDCITCKKLRGSLCNQMMADLPSDRLECIAVFENSGVDLFGPFEIYEGKKTRRNEPVKQIHVVIFVCMTSRAIHLEPCPGLDASSFRNALARFIAVRGTVKRLRSDNGTNLVCISKQLNTELSFDQVKNDLSKKGIEWEFNPPHASHFGGFYERKIGAVRRILESTMRVASSSRLSRDEFYTVLQECASIVNNTPLWDATTSPDDPMPLTPAALLTLREPHTEVTVEDFTE